MNNYDSIFNSQPKQSDSKSFSSFNKEEWAASKKQEREQAYALIDETAEKVHKIAPVDAQTGPARRGDKVVTNSHLSMLDGRLKEIYALVSDYIAVTAKKNENK